MSVIGYSGTGKPRWHAPHLLERCLEGQADVPTFRSKESLKSTYVWFKALSRSALTAAVVNRCRRSALKPYNSLTLFARRVLYPLKIRYTLHM
jgi:hypothetical protein